MLNAPPPIAVLVFVASALNSQLLNDIVPAPKPDEKTVTAIIALKNKIAPNKTFFLLTRKSEFLLETFFMPIVPK